MGSVREGASGAFFNPSRQDDAVKQKPPQPQLRAQVWLLKLLQGPPHTWSPLNSAFYKETPHSSACASHTQQAAPPPSPYSTHECKCFAYTVGYHASTSLRAEAPGPVEIPPSCSRGPSFWAGLVVCVSLPPLPAAAHARACRSGSSAGRGKQPITKKRTIFTELHLASTGRTRRASPKTTRNKELCAPRDLPGRKTRGPTRISQLSWRN